MYVCSTVSRVISSQYATPISATCPSAYLDASSLPVNLKGSYCWIARINYRRRDNVFGRGGAPITTLVFIPHELVP
eukprot:11223144-Lingulodinium_polyedra.AAC.1